MPTKKRKSTKKGFEELLQEFDLINPYAPDLPRGGAIDKDFEPTDPGWMYPDSDRGPRYPIIQPPQGT